MAAAKEEAAGSDRAELKKLLKAAREKPVSMALAMANDGSAIIKLDRIKAPRALEKALKEEEGSKSHRFGTVVIDQDAPKVAKFIVNKQIGGGIARKIVIALKGTGFSKVKLVTEDGQSVEEAGEEDAGGNEDEAPDADAGRPGKAAATKEAAGASQAAPPASPSPSPPTPDQPSAGSKQPATPAAASPSPPAQDEPGTGPKQAASDQKLTALAKELTGLIKQALSLLKQDTGKRKELAGYAKDAQASIKRGDADRARSQVEKLSQAVYAALDAARATTAERNGDPEQPARRGDAGPEAGAADAGQHGAAGAPAKDGQTGGLDPATVKKLQKSHTVWDATLTKVTAEMDKLAKAVKTATSGHELGTTFESDFQKAVAPLLKTVDSSLSNILARASKARDANEQQQALEEARATIKRFTEFAQSNPLIEHLDRNPFAPIAIGKALTASLSAIATIVR
jgi:hypothetical protein